jgi:tripartite-type tricarboxylate transporter receptor subunit TctC
VPFPEKPVDLVIGFAAGGALDLVGRALAESITECWDQPLTITNRDGAGGTIAASEVVEAAPDGYTSYLAPVAAMAAQPHRANSDTAYQGPDDYQPVANLVYFPQVLAVGADAPYSTIEEFIAYAKEHPGDITVGSGGEGTLPHLTLEALKQQAEIDLTHVPFNGFAESVPAVIGGSVDAIIVTPADMVPHVEAGTAKIIGVFSGDRIDTFPDSPTFKEAGVDFVQDNYYFVMVPKGTPTEVVSTYADALKCAVETDSFEEFAADRGAVIDYLGPDDTKARVQSDFDRFGSVITELGL